MRQENRVYVNRYFAGLVLFLSVLLMHAAVSAAEIAPLTISVRCLPVSGCLYTGKKIDIVISITNTSNEEVGLTLGYLNEVGPHVQLIDVETKKKSDLHVSLGQHALLDRFEPLAPGASVTFDTKIMAYEMTLFRKKFVNLDVRVAFSGKKKIGSATPERIDETAYFKIMSPDALEIDELGKVEGAVKNK